MKKISLFFISICLLNFAFAQKGKAKREPSAVSDRVFWLQEMDKMVKPTLYSLAQDSLRIVMPKVTSKNVDNREHRIAVQYLEVLGRVLCGVAPWLQLEGGDAYEVQLREQYRKWTIQGLENALDSTANDFMRFDLGGQQLVDASFLAVAIVRAPWIWGNLSAEAKKHLVESIKTTRRFRPVFSNWLLFSAMNEAFLAKFDGTWDVMRVDYALRQLEQWYVGDGMYMDGTHYAYDYYNSYVIHPYLSAIADVIGEKTGDYRDMFEKIKKRNQRYAIIQERLINMDGTYPASGRSVIYRGAAFHHLADMALKRRLPEALKPAQVRGALTAVLKKTTESPTTYKDGWLTIGLYGEQWGLGDFYNNQGSPYIATNIFLPLGLPETDEFWTGPSLPWSSQLIWTGSQDAKKDYGVDLR
ncbi:DUF2264 domain-containing protein [Sphingobacterium alkalisoli]|uniref:DUF2264 domain-containing protein n=1 Tax=Sphingobacterium alkalisoli TaxID=1874115 RepID=A0A4U0H0G4_9SPHI|nr:DUF2264 domain-containing protein [Sphingobacterium alkalisoli]TJY64494.1 DUF2264 domain-containing protein [Sphingobacterium alkalisoli]GGH21417.1 hypothetical protein GCM10011418_27260 [Sphingobacterium alkalisoli]